MNIEVLSQNADFYWGALSRMEMNLLNTSIENYGFIDGIKNHEFSEKFNYGLDINRSNSIKFLFSTKVPYKVLEIGCGYGNLTSELAKIADEVHAIDAVHESLLFTKHRLDYEKISNVKLFQTDIFETPNFLKNFDSGFYDLIVINGVLEWVGSGSKEGNPQNYQKQFLNECCQKLKEDGFLFLAIENRFYPGWIKRDPHSKLPFTAIAPRVIANIISLLLTRKSYRTYIYGFQSLTKMMKGCGLSLNSKFYVYHSYRSPLILFQNNVDYAREVLKLVPKNMLSRKWKSFIKLGINYRVIDMFIPTFTHIYTKNQDSTFILDHKYGLVEKGRLKLEGKDL
jgi:SAM-dependent methyltransferase